MCMDWFRINVNCINCKMKNNFLIYFVIKYIPSKCKSIFAFFFYLLLQNNKCLVIYFNNGVVAGWAPPANIFCPPAESVLNVVLPFCQ